MSLKKSLRFLFFFALIALSGQKLFAQGEQKYIIFSGFVIDSKTNEPLPNAYLQIPRAGKGTLANNKGYFVLYAFPGDSVIFSYVGFKKQYHIIPKKAEVNYSAVVELQEDAKMLREVKVYPFNTEEEFKRALVEMNLPDEKERKILEETFSPTNISRLAAIQGMSSGENYRYAMQQQMQQIQSRGTVNTNPLLSPFAWMNFIKSVKNGSLKDKSWKGAAEMMPRDKVSRDEIFRNNN